MHNIPPLIYGTAWKKERTADLVEKAVMHGFRGIDTACQPKHYHEPGAGQALERLRGRGIARERLYIQTKYTPVSGQDPSSIPYDPSAPIADQVRQSCQVSLKNLGVDYLDGLLLHSPLVRHAHTMEAWHAFEELHAQGLAYTLGISNCYELNALESIYNEAVVKPAILQNRFYAATGYDKDLRQWCGKNNVIYQSFWTLTANPAILNHPRVRAMASMKDVTVEQLFFRFLTQQGIVPLIGTCSEEHMQLDLAIFEFALTDDEVNQINSLL